MTLLVGLPKEQRAVRDLLRRRMQLVHVAAGCLISIQSKIWRSTGCRVSSSQVRKPDFELPLSAGYVHQAAQTMLSVQRAVQQEIDALEQTALSVARVASAFKVLQSVTGIGPILGITIWLKTGDIRHQMRQPKCIMAVFPVLHALILLDRRRVDQPQTEAGVLQTINQWLFECRSIPQKVS